LSAPEITLVVARARNGVIGRGASCPGTCPADLMHFKEVTMGTPMIMGRRTFESLPGLLPGRGISSLRANELVGSRRGNCPCRR
jgi:dihydrofolate reductase